jgi:hypothetical protein
MEYDLFKKYDGKKCQKSYRNYRMSFFNQVEKIKIIFHIKDNVDNKKKIEIVLITLSH